MNRDVRRAPDAALFNSRTIPVTSPDTLPDALWWRLYQKQFLNQFYPSKGSRLTPNSWAYPCVYLAVNLKTTVGEVWGDRFALAQSKGRKTYSITKKEAAALGYLRVDQLPSDLKLCNLTDSQTLTAVGIDLGTLYTTDLTITQAWAERIARHPASFDGISYGSRHTHELCVVLWMRPSRDLSTELTFIPDGDFMYSKPAYECAAAVGLKLAFI